MNGISVVACDSPPPGVEDDDEVSSVLPTFRVRGRRGREGIIDRSHAASFQINWSLDKSASLLLRENGKQGKRCGKAIGRMLHFRPGVSMEGKKRPFY